ncbi:MAG: competence/damage-inducible protein A [Thermoanaerobaculia bacterium]
MRAAILAVGSELLGFDRLDTNSLHLTEILLRHGVEPVQKGVVGDSVAEIAAAAARLLDRADILLVTGGLGPTADDVTRGAIASLLGRELTVDEGVVEVIRERFRRLGVAMPEVNRRQAEVIAGARLLANTRGTAPGQWIETDGRVVILLPGVPAELREIVASDVEPWLAARGAGAGTEQRTLRIACLPESVVEERIAEVYQRFGREAISILASPGEIRIRGYASGGPDERRATLEAIEEAVRARLGEAVFGVGDTSLEVAVGEALAGRSETVAVAESCTAGLVAERLTRVPGSSAWVLGGVVAYADRVKRELLGVDQEALDRHGAVSAAVATAMARGARQRLGADWGIGVTGIAGPGGGSEEKPVGTVHIAVDGGSAERLVHHHLRLTGDRQTVRRISSQWALDALRRALSGLPQLRRAASSPEYSG